jgi:hypothetical protein
VKDPAYVVANLSNNKSVKTGLSFANEALAQDYLKTHVTQNPNDAGEVHVIPAFDQAA